jgi:hypothetical protein
MVDVSVPLTNTTGRPRDAILVAATNPDGSLIGAGGAGDNSAVVAKLEQIRLQNVDIIQLLTEIRDNTASA